MKKGFLAALAVGAVFASGCSRVLRVGVVLPETGSAAEYGASIKSGVKLGFDEELAGRTTTDRLEIEFRDSASDPTRAVSHFDTLCGRGALVVIGGATSAEARPMITAADRLECVLLSPSASAPELSRLSPYFFRLYPSDELEGVHAADFLTVRRGARSVLIIEEDNTYTRGLLPVFVGELRNRRARVVGSVRVGESGWERDVRESLVKQRPDAAYICGYGDAILAALRVVRGAGFTGTICTTSAVHTASLLARAGTLTEGIFFPLASVDWTSKEDAVRNFVKHYQEAYNLLPDIYAAHGYDAARAVLAALRAPGAHTGKELQTRLRALRMKGVTGLLAFDEFGNVRRALRDQRVHNGRVQEWTAESSAQSAPGGGAADSANGGR